ncbi:hypothetical protein ACWD5B_22145 [Streptomyces tanashiensis]
MTREELIPLAERLMTPETSEEEFSQIPATLERGLVCPHISDYRFRDLAPDLTPGKVVDRTMAYKTTAL